MSFTLAKQIYIMIFRHVSSITEKNSLNGYFTKYE